MTCCFDNAIGEENSLLKKFDIVETHAYPQGGKERRKDWRFVLVTIAGQ